MAATKAGGAAAENPQRRAKLANDQAVQQDTLSQALRQHLSDSLFSKTCTDTHLGAFGRTYALHRVFLIQANFFHSLFNGDFNEAKRWQFTAHANQRKDGQGSFSRPSMNTNESTTGKCNNDDGSIPLHFDDPNITRAAFEYCIAFLYGIAPQLVLPTWASPTPSHPLTSHFEPANLARLQQQYSKDQSYDEADHTYDSRATGAQDVKDCNGSTDSDNSIDDEDHDDDDEQNSEEANVSLPRQPATPRFLLSLLATATYLGIPSVTAQAVTLIVCSITPFTVSHYLRFALGYGIHGALDAKQRQASCKALDFWDWELEGPAWGLADLSTKQTQSSPSTGPHIDMDDLVRVTSELQTDDCLEAGRKHSRSLSHGGGSVGDTYTAQTADSDKSTDSFDLYNYGGQWNKIGEACSCWLLRWGADVLLAEEHLHSLKIGERKVNFSDPFILPYGQMPVQNALTSTDFPRQVRSILTTPFPLVWCSTRFGGIPAEWLRAIISCDSFWICEEWDRYDIARRAVTLRRANDQKLGVKLSSSSSNADVDAAAAQTTHRHAKRGSIDDELNQKDALRDETEYERLFSEGIYYTHMSFARLSAISNDVCEYTGQPFVPLHILQSSLWTQSEMKNIILSKHATSKNEHSLDSRNRDDEDEEDMRGVPDVQREGRDIEGDSELGLVSKEDEFAKAYAKIAHAYANRGRTARAHLGDDGKPTALGGVTPLMQPPNLQRAASSALETLLSKRFYAVPADDTVRTGENLASLASTSQPQQQMANSSTHAETRHRHGGVSADAPCGVAAAPAANTLSLAQDGYAKQRASSLRFFGLENSVHHGHELGKRSSQESTSSTSKGTAGEDDGDDDDDEHNRTYYESTSIWTKEAMLGDTSAHEGTSATNATASYGWTGFEPMRIGVEFFDVNRLSEKQRLYSPSFFYAGSVWNLYVQTVKKPKGLQLGIYLHRQNCNDNLPSPSLPYRLLGGHTAAVYRGGTGQQQQQSMGRITEEHRIRMPRGLFYSNGPIISRARTASRGTQSRSNVRPSPYSPTPSPLAAIGDADGSTQPVNDGSILSLRQLATAASAADDVVDDAGRPTYVSPGAGNESSAFANVTVGGNLTGSNAQALEVPYFDQRQSLRAYFSIHCPSPMGTSLTKFSSRPDRFTLSQSWGWKSSSLLGAVYLHDGKLGTGRNQVSQTFRCVVTMGVV